MPCTGRLLHKERIQRATSPDAHVKFGVFVTILPVRTTSGSLSLLKSEAKKHSRKNANKHWCCYTILSSIVFLKYFLCLFMEACSTNWASGSPSMTGTIHSRGMLWTWSHLSPWHIHCVREGREAFCRKYDVQLKIILMWYSLLSLVLVETRRPWINKD